MSGRRVYPRFSQLRPADGQIRISRDVDVEIDESTSGISVLSDVPAVPGEELTLSLVNKDGEMELRVRVIETTPHLSNGALRHRMRLEVLSGRASQPGSEERSE